MIALRTPNPRRAGMTTACLLLAVTCHAQQGQKENPQCAPGQTAHDGVCIDEDKHKIAGQTVEEPPVNRTPKPPHDLIPTCGPNQTIKEGKCVPKT
jgi:hypothetical protein